MESSFNLPKKTYILFKILHLIISIFSLSLLYPLSIYLQHKSYVKYIRIDGKKLTFHGKLIEVYLRYIFWTLFTSLFLVLYQILLNQIRDFLPSFLFRLLSSTLFAFLSSFFLRASLRKWKYASLKVEGEKGESYYKGNIFSLLFYQTWIQLANLLSAGLFYLPIRALKMQYEMKHVVLSSHYLENQWKIKESLITYGKYLTLMILTLGLYWFYLDYDFNKNWVEHLHFKD